jgi:large subunit ribosomal protein L30
MSSLKVRSIKSWAGRPERQRQTLRGLGLKKLNDERLLPDSPAVMGMLQKVTHLVSWQRVEAAAAPRVRTRRPKGEQAH